VSARLDARNRVFWKGVHAHSAVKRALLPRSSELCTLRSQQAIFFVELALQHGSKLSRRKRIGLAFHFLPQRGLRTLLIMIMKNQSNVRDLQKNKKGISPKSPQKTTTLGLMVDGSPRDVVGLLLE
jgi:hypothetical protein